MVTAYAESGMGVNVMKRLIAAWMLLFTLALSAASPVWAYSYGDPNEEELATMFKDAVVKIGASDWKGASALYQAKRAEIESHFGGDVAVNLDRSFEAQDKELTEQNLKALLVLNLERRFEYGERDIEDYSKSKLLLAKARATYDALEPYVQAKLPKETAGLKASFDSALEALGNPGLFGVGKKAVDPEAYKKHTAYILNTVSPIFPSKAAQAPAAASAPAQPTAAPAGAGGKPADANPAPAAAAAPAAAPAASAPADASAAASAAPSAAPASGAPQDGSAAPSDSPPPSASPSPEGAGAASPAASAASPSASASVPAPEATAKAAAAHAPMQREDKTNSGVTFAVIGGVVLAAGGTFWWARRKGIF